MPQNEAFFQNFPDFSFKNYSNQYKPHKSTEEATLQIPVVSHIFQGKQKDL